MPLSPYRWHSGLNRSIAPGHAKLFLELKMISKENYCCDASIVFLVLTP